MSTPVLILLCTDIALTITGVVLRRRLEGRMPRGISIGFVVVFGAFLIHCLGAAPLAVSLSGDALSQAQFIRINGYLGFLPMIVFARFFLEAVSSGGAEALFGLNTGLRVESDFSKAKALERGGNVDGAIDQYRRYFREEPGNPQALFAIGRLQSDEGRYNDAADTYRQIVGKFRDEDDIWARATFHLAEILEAELHDKKAAEHLLRQMLKRTPKSRHAAFARSRLLPTGDVADQFYRGEE